MAEQKLSPGIIALLEEACEDTMSNFEVNLHDNNGGGQGYMGEMVCSCQKLVLFYLTGK